MQMKRVRQKKKRIDWEARLRNKPFLVSLFSLILLVTQQAFLIFGVDISIVSAQIEQLINSVLALLVLLGLVVDTSTDGLFDNEKEE